MIELSAVSARIGAVQILSEISLKVARGRFATVIGANGAGKTTLLRVISNLLPASSGRTRVCLPPRSRMHAGHAFRITPEGPSEAEAALISSAQCRPQAADYSLQKPRPVIPPSGGVFSGRAAALTSPRPDAPRGHETIFRGRRSCPETKAV